MTGMDARICRVLASCRVSVELRRLTTTMVFWSGAMRAWTGSEAVRARPAMEREATLMAIS